MSGDPRRSVERGEWLSTCRPGTLGGVVVPPVRDSDALCLAELDRSPLYLFVLELPAHHPRMHLHVDG